VDPARLNEPRAPGRGLTIIQIDGLSLPALRAAMERGRCERVRALVPGARVRHLAGLGHLAHEEAPARLAALLLDVLRSRSGPGGEAEPCS